MFSSLRNQLILSHTLPYLIIIPLMGVILVYALETHYILPSLERNLIDNAEFLAASDRGQGGIWNNPTLAQRLLNQLPVSSNQLVMFLGPGGQVLGSTGSIGFSQAEMAPRSQDISTALNGKLVARSGLDLGVDGEIVEILSPVVGPNEQVLGVVRIVHRYTTATGELLQVRYVIIGILLLGLLSGGLLGFFLALNIGRPVQEASEAIEYLALRERREKLSLQGPDEIRRLERSVNFLVDRLNNLEQARRQLLANLVHELGRPLGALRIAIQVTLGGANKNPKILDELLVGMDEEAASLERLVNDLAHLHDQVLGTLELDYRPIALAEWLPKVLVTWKEAAVKKNLEWIESVPNNLPTIQADPNRLNQVIGNLASNAIKYTETGKKVTISAGETGQAVWIQISDSGAGIPVEEQEKIFTPFYRGNHGRRFKQGMGLGLSIARDLIQAHGGKIEISSSPGLGSKFTIWLPKSRASQMSLSDQQVLYKVN